MALADVIFEESDSALGALLELSDGVAGYVLTGDSNGDIVQGTPILFTSLPDAVAKGLALATNPFAYKVIKEHYDQTGDGAECYVMLVSNAMTVNMMADKTNVNGAVKLLDFAEGKVRVLGLMDDPASHSVTVTNGLDANVYTAKANAQLLGAQYDDTEKSPMWIIIGGTGFNGTASALTDQNLSSDDYASIMIGDTVSGVGCALGVAVGRACAIPVQRKISRVKSGALAIPGLAAYIGTTLVEKSTAVSTIHDKSYITLRKWKRKAGYYFANDFTCCASTNDFKFGARRRVMNKVKMIGYAVLVDEIDEEVPVESDGKIDASYAMYLQKTLDNQVNGIMTVAKEISGFTSFIDPNQNILSTSLTEVVLKPTPVGYNGNIKGKLAFNNPANS